jgi:hypothetical protein
MTKQPSPTKIRLPTSKTSSSVLQLPLKSADLGLSLLVSLLPARDTVIHLVTATFIYPFRMFVVFLRLVQPDSFSEKPIGAVLAIFGIFDIIVALFDLLFELSNYQFNAADRILISHNYQIDRVLNSIVGRLVKFVDQQLHIFSNLVDDLCGLLDVGGACFVFFVDTAEGVRCFLQDAADIFHLCMWSACRVKEDFGSLLFGQCCDGLVE